MITVDRAVGRLDQQSVGGRRLEWVTLDFEAMVKGHQRVRTDVGTEVGISLARADRLAEGDVLYADAERVIAVRAAADDALVIPPTEPMQWGLVGSSSRRRSSFPTTTRWKPSCGSSGFPSAGNSALSPGSALVHTLTDDALQSLLQLSGAAFPTGAFSHSYGLETFVQSGQVHDLATFREWLDTHLGAAAAPTDGAAVALVQRAAAGGDWAAVVRVDLLLTALKLAPETRAASLATGQAALRAAREVSPGPALDRCAALVAERRARGNAATWPRISRSPRRPRSSPSSGASPPR